MGGEVEQVVLFSEAGGKRSKSALATMTWQVEQAIAPRSFLKRLALAWARSSNWCRGRLDLAIEGSVGLEEAHAGHAGSIRCSARGLADAAAGRCQFLLAGVAAEAEADRRARLTLVKPSARSTWLGRPEPDAQAEPSEGDVADVGDQPRGIEAVAPQLRLPHSGVERAAIESSRSP